MNRFLCVNKCKLNKLFRNITIISVFILLLFTFGREVKLDSQQTIPWQILESNLFLSNWSSQRAELDKLELVILKLEKGHWTFSVDHFSATAEKKRK